MVDQNVDPWHPASGLVYLVAGVASPLFGFIIDRTRRNISWVLGSLAGMTTTVFLLTHLYLVRHKSRTDFREYMGGSPLGIKFPSNVRKVP
jgi:hypothetical protein